MIDAGINIDPLIRRAQKIESRAVEIETIRVGECMPVITGSVTGNSRITGRNVSHTVIQHAVV